MDIVQITDRILVSIGIGMSAAFQLFRFSIMTLMPAIENIKTDVICEGLSLKRGLIITVSILVSISPILLTIKNTQKELGVMCGFSLSSADVRIAQYEKNKKIPREKILKAMCNALGVGEGALVHADMLSYQEMFYALFDMEDFHGLHPVKKEDGYYLRFGSDSIINDFLKEWYKMYQKYPRPRGDDEEEKYTLCRYEYPNEIAVVSQYELLKRKALQVEIENLQLQINDLENENKEGD